MELLRDVRKELAVKEEHGAGSKENFERLSQKYERAKAKVRCGGTTLHSSYLPWQFSHLAAKALISPVCSYFRGPRVRRRKCGTVWLLAIEKAV